MRARRCAGHAHACASHAAGATHSRRTRVCVAFAFSSFFWWSWSLPWSLFVTKITILTLHLKSAATSPKIVHMLKFRATRTSPGDRLFESTSADVGFLLMETDDLDLAWIWTWTTGPGPLTLTMETTKMTSKSYLTYVKYRTYLTYLTAVSSAIYRKALVFSRKNSNRNFSCSPASLRSAGL